MLSAIKGKLRYLAGLPSFMRHTMDIDEAHARIEHELANRESSFLYLVEHGVYANPSSAFRKLLLNAGIEMDELRRMVATAGLEGAISQLYDAGVYLTYEEMLGRMPVRRGALALTVDAAALDNPLLRSPYEMQSSGSTGGVSRSFIDLTSLEHESAYFGVLLEAHRMHQPIAIWGPAPPSLWGINFVLRYTKIGCTPVRWFSLTRSPNRGDRIRAYILVLLTVAAGWMAGKRLPWARFVPPTDALKIARWMASMKAKGTPVMLETSASSATRVCIAAREHDLDIAGSVFRVGGEPYTIAKAAVITSAGCRAIDAYAATEFGIAGLGCADPLSQDDMHLATDKLLVQTRPKAIDSSGATVDALVYTTTLPNCRRVLINAESGDYGELHERRCACALGDVGFSTHLTGLYGYDKLTSEGVNFLGSELFKLMEEVLPERFGGHTTDYQLVEREDADGIPHVDLVISPTVGPVAEAEVVELVLRTLRGYSNFAGYGRGPLMAEQWRQGNTLAVVRREPYSSGGRKILPLHMLQARATSVAATAAEHARS